jgi:hypothetical protein
MGPQHPIPRGGGPQQKSDPLVGATEEVPIPTGATEESTIPKGATTESPIPGGSDLGIVHVIVCDPVHVQAFSVTVLE